MIRTEPMLAAGAYEEILAQGREALREKRWRCGCADVTFSVVCTVVCSTCSKEVELLQPKVLCYVSRPEPPSNAYILCRSCGEQISEELASGAESMTVDMGIGVELVALPPYWPGEGGVR